MEQAKLATCVKEESSKNWVEKERKKSKCVTLCFSERCYSLPASHHKYNKATLLCSTLGYYLVNLGMFTRRVDWQEETIASRSSSIVYKSMVFKWRSLDMSLFALPGFVLTFLWAPNTHHSGNNTTHLTASILDSFSERNATCEVLHLKDLSYAKLELSTNGIYIFQSTSCPMQCPCEQIRLVYRKTAWLVEYIENYIAQIYHKIIHIYFFKNIKQPKIGKIKQEKSISISQNKQPYLGYVFLIKEWDVIIQGQIDWPRSTVHKAAIKTLIHPIRLLSRSQRIED